MRISTILVVKRCGSRGKKCTNQFVVWIIIARYQEGWLKVC
jgi:hypothetical protein